MAYKPILAIGMIAQMEPEVSPAGEIEVGLPSGSWASSVGTRRSMQGNRSRDTVPELAVRRLIHRAGLRYSIDSMPVAKIRRRADIVFTVRKIAVFIDGCFWHGCPEHFVAPKSHVEYWDAKINRNCARDRATDESLKAAGWHVLRYWSHEDPTSVAADIIQCVRCADRQRVGT
jgi:DNA mismatch endonuclease (patch repair protein)